MLTDSEREWLEQRDAIRFALDGYRVPCLDGPYEMRPDYEAAAEFESRVAAKLAERCVLLEKVVQKTLGVAEYINLSAAAENVLKAARLQVEEEMDG